MRSEYQFKFKHGVRLPDAELSLQLALLAAEGLHGIGGVRLDAPYTVDRSRRTIGIEGGSNIGGEVVRMFTTFLAHGLGENAFVVTSRPRRHGESQ